MTTETAQAPANDAGQAPTAETPVESAPVTAETPIETPAKTNWYDGFSDEDIGLIQNNKWEESPAGLMEGYNGLLKLRGVPADQLIKVPGADDADGWNGLYDKLGRPESADKYEFTPAEGAEYDDGRVKGFAEVAHKYGLNQEQAAGIVADVFAQEAQMIEAANKEREVQSQADLANLKSELGSAYEERVELGRRFVRDVVPGASDDEKAVIVDKIEQAIGTANLIRMFGEAGFKANKGESRFVESSSATTQFGMTPEQAKAEIQTMRTDPEISKKVMTPGSKEKERFSQLHKVAFGDAPVGQSS